MPSIENSDNRQHPAWGQENTRLLGRDHSLALWSFRNRDVWRRGRGFLADDSTMEGWPATNKYHKEGRRIVEDIIMLW